MEKLSRGREIIVLFNGLPALHGTVISRSLHPDYRYILLYAIYVFQINGEPRHQFHLAVGFCGSANTLDLANRMTASTPVRKTHGLFRAQRRFFISNPTPSVESRSFGKRMGAAGFEPATTWSEAKHSVQTELSALERP